MRAGMSTIQQTLTAEAATVLTHSIAEASRRNHGQTTPLHVAATLLGSPSGFLRQACIRSHPNSSHPLQCRALELCFSVALERLPTAQSADTSGTEPPISNALMAALKRAQAHQRRGCPEQQQQPLLAVKVELEQLIISILDDPSVSRVMREASFSSPAVKAAIEQSLNGSNTQAHHTNHLTGRNVNLGPGFGAIPPRMVPNSGQLTQPLLSSSGQLTPPLLSNSGQVTTTPLLSSSGQLTAPVAQNPSPLANRNVYLNPRLQQGATAQMGNPKADEVRKLLEIMVRSKKRNPVLVGDSLPEAVVKELLRKIDSKELESDGNLKNVQVISMEKGLLSDKNRMASKIDELGEVIGTRIKNGGVILDLGDLKWLVEQPQAGLAQMQKQPVVSEIGRAVVVEMTKLLARFARFGDGGGDESNKLWLIGTATTETYLRCKVYHPTMENDWDLEAVPITSKSPLPGMFPRLGGERILSNSLESFNPLKAVPSSLPTLTRLVSENSDPAQKSTFCPQCSDNYEKELTKLAAIDKLLSQAKQDAAKPSLPQWLQNAKLNTTETKTTDESQGNDQGLLSKQKTQELHKKWRETCLHLHPNFHRNSKGPPPLSLPTLYNPSLLSRPPFTPKLQTMKPLGAALQLNTNQFATQPPRLANISALRQVRTDLALGREAQDSTPEIATEGDQAKDLLGCISSEPQTKLLEKFSNALDADTYKKLLKGLMEKAWWQAEAASAVASAITRCRLGNGKRRGAGSRGDIWLLFTGPDRVGKRKMASVLAEQICGTSPVVIPLPERKDDGDSDTNFRGKRAVDRIAEAVRQNPFLVIVLEDIDEADVLVRGSIKRAVERGRLTDSYGREVGLGNTVFIVTGDWSTVSQEALREERFVDEKKLASIASGSWQLGLIVREKTAKRRANWMHEDDEVRPLIRPRKEMGSALSLDLNLSAAYGGEDDRTDGSHNSSDLTVDHEDELGLVTRHFSITSVPHELVSNVDDSIVFKPVDSAFVRREIKKTIAVKFSMVVDENLSIEVGDDVLQKILGGLWHDRISLGEWIENVLSTGFDQLKTRLPSGDRSGSVVRLVVESDSGSRGKSTGNADWLPSSILV